MNIEREKKFKVIYIPTELITKRVFIEQHYLYRDKFTSIRKRKIEENREKVFCYTIKTEQKNSKDLIELERKISEEEYNSIKNYYGTIEKERLLIPLNNTLTAEVDVFKGKLEGLVICEVEYETETLNLNGIDWIGEELERKKYGNDILATLTKEEAENFVKEFNS